MADETILLAKYRRAFSALSAINSGCPDVQATAYRALQDCLDMGDSTESFEEFSSPEARRQFETQEETESVSNLKAQVATLNERLNQILYDTKYEGGLQWWIKKHDELGAALAESTRIKVDLGERLIGLLNEALAADPSAMTALVNVRVSATCPDLIDHPNFVVRQEPAGNFTFGLIGFLNGLFKEPKDRICAILNQDGKLVGFGRYQFVDRQHPDHLRGP